MIPFGDRAVRFTLPAGPRGALLARLRAVPGVEDVVLAETVGLARFVDPSVPAALARALAEPALGPSPTPRRHTIEVVYDGEDLAELATRLGCTPAEIVQLHSAPTYRVALVGFAPGFAYLRGGPPALALPRRAPRPRVPAGSVAIAAGYSGVYPFASSGGWHLLGHAPTFVAFAEGHATLALDDEVRFVPRVSTPSRATAASAARLAGGDGTRADRDGTAACADRDGIGARADNHGDASLADSDGVARLADRGGDASRADTDGIGARADRDGTGARADNYGDASLADSDGVARLADRGGDASRADTDSDASRADTDSDASRADNHGTAHVADGYGYADSVATLADGGATARRGGAAPNLGEGWLELTHARGIALLVDGGRAGRLAEGIPPGGPLVRGWLGAANAAVGNAPDACGVELYGTFEVTARDGDVLVAEHEPVLLRRGEVLRVATEARRVTYLAVAGGIDAPQLLGSGSFLATTGTGGPLRRGAALRPSARPTRRKIELHAAHCALATPNDARLGRRHDVASRRHVTGTVRLPLCAGPDGDVLAHLQGLTISAASNRTGTRLDGYRGPQLHAPDRPSTPMILGAMELTPTGPIVLGPDHPTTGGYPVVGVLPHAALDAFFALPIGARVSFRRQ